MSRERFKLPRIRLASRLQAVGCSLPAFQTLGCIGLGLAMVLTMTLVGHQHLSHWVMTGVIGAAVATFFGLVTAAKIITGQERLIYYHHQIAVMVAVALLLWIVRQPLLSYLDITVLGIGTFLAFGRVGCLMVGCCHGRPHRWGIRYRAEHARAGFPSCLVGVRLFPIQAVESLWVLGTVVVGAYLVWSGRQPGSALAWYVVSYDAGRFAFEFARGDSDRPYWLGFSQAQWIALLLTGGVVGAELADRLPPSRWHLAAFAFLAAAMIAVSLRRLRKTSEFQLLHPHHIRQVASAVQALAASAGRAVLALDENSTVISVARTSLGIQISAGHLVHGAERVYHYTLSSASEPMTEGAARSLAGLIRRLTGTAGSDELMAGTHGVFHLLIYLPEARNS